MNKTTVKYGLEFREFIEGHRAYFPQIEADKLELHITRLNKEKRAATE